MAKQKARKTAVPEPLSSLDRLGLRVSAMLTSPKAQVDRRVLIHRLDGDTDEAWERVMELLADTDGISLEFTDEGDVVVEWEADPDQQVMTEPLLESEEEQAPF